ncbi:hypothetical protein B0H67DRAFT_645827 [Lasiosphaeris hirsuta]|uniref:Uncharacterized protein n=1 Tax=Lasiosphaeris hirsuta TaxID=260670 RepID=A0AA40DYE4_9PEZI|nr:hypothetical protein B0H67DRAFT_645827 [Lasiosphaeris hirsuta]
MEYLRRQYSVDDVFPYPPFLVLGCSDVPSADTRPFAVGGFIAIWRALDDMASCPFPGEDGRDIDTEPEVEESLLHSFVLNVMPDPRALMKLAAFIVPDCVGVAWVNNFVVFEFVQCDDMEQWHARLEKLPGRVSDAQFYVSYSNGPLVYNQLAKRAKNPTPHRAPEIRINDDTDYVARDRVFYPGSMISSAWKGETQYSATAGILLERNGQQRSDDPLSNEVFIVYQGDTLSPVGTVVERVGQTDMALARLYDGIDSFTTSRTKQNLAVVGVKVELPRTPGAEHPEIVAPANSDDLLPAPEAIATFKILPRPGRNRVEGLRATLSRDEVFGMMHLADITSRRAYVSQYLIYADSFTPLIQRGWTVVPLPGTAPTANVTVPDQLGERGESPRKRSRRE